MKTLAVLWMVAVSVVILTLGTAAPAAAWGYVELNDSQEPGSVLVFPKFLKGTVNNPDQGDIATGLPRSQFKISVVCPNGVDCSQVPTVRIKAHWVCAGGPTSVCAERDFTLTTTVWGTVLFNGGDSNGTQVVNDDVTGGYCDTGPGGDPHAGPMPNANCPAPAVNPPACNEGYLMVWVVNGNDQPIKFDGLIGNAVLRSNSTILGVVKTSNSTRSYNAIPIQAADELFVSAPPFNIVNPSGDGSLVFDGSPTGYKAVTGTVYGNLRFNNMSFGSSDQDTQLTLLTLDVRSNQVNPETDVALTFYAQDETPYSGGVQFFCWGDFRVGFGGLGLTENSVGSSYGLVKSTGALQGTTGVTLMGIIESKETSDFGRRDYAYPLYNDSIPVHTTFYPF